MRLQRHGLTPPNILMLMAMMWCIPCVPAVSISQNIVTLQFQRALVYGSMVRGAVTTEEIERFCIRSKLVLELENCPPENVAKALKRWYTTGDKGDIYHFLIDKYGSAKVVAAAMSVDELRFFMTTERVQRCLDMLPFFDVMFQSNNFLVTNYPVIDKVENMDLCDVVKGEAPVRRIEGQNYVEKEIRKYVVQQYKYEDDLLWQDWPPQMASKVVAYSNVLVAREKRLEAQIASMLEERFYRDILGLLRFDNYRIEKIKNAMYIFLLSDRNKEVYTIEIVYSSELNCT